MRKSIHLMLVLCLLLVSSVSVVFAKKKPVEIVYYAARSQEQWEPVYQAFRKEYPNIEVKLFRAGIEELFSILELEMMTGQVRADVIHLPDPIRTEMFKEEGWLEKFTIPEKDLAMFIDDSYMDPEGYWVGLLWSGIALQYNKNFFTEDKLPSSWADLLNERYRGQLAMGDPQVTGMVHIFMRYIIHDLYEKYGEPYGWNYFEKLTKLVEPRLFSGHTQIQSLVAVGEMPLAIQTLSRCYKSVQDGEPTGYIYPKEGTPIQFDAVGIAKGTKNFEAAQTFVRWMVTRNGQIAHTKAGTPPIRRDVPLDLPYGEAVADLNLVPMKVLPEDKADQADGLWKLMRK